MCPVWWRVVVKLEAICHPIPPPPLSPSLSPLSLLLVAAVVIGLALQRVSLCGPAARLPAPVITVCIATLLPESEWSRPYQQLLHFLSSAAAT